MFGIDLSRRRLYIADRLWQESAAVPPIHRSPAPHLGQSGLKVLVYLRDVQHDALPVRPVCLHQLLDFLFGTQHLGVRSM